MEMILSGQNCHGKHNSKYFKPGLCNTWRVLLQPTGGFIHPISTYVSGQLTRISMSLGRSVDDRSRWLWGHTEGTPQLIRWLAVRINTHSVCLLGNSALPLSLKQMNCSCFLCRQNRFSRAKDGISYNLSAFCWGQSAAVESSSWKFQGIWKWHVNDDMC